MGLGKILRKTHPIGNAILNSRRGRGTPSGPPLSDADLATRAVAHRGGGFNASMGGRRNPGMAAKKAGPPATLASKVGATAKKAGV